ncbi:hypothetical protein NGG52_01675 [Mammaliicoccus sciuri]|uniref:hypothetical protein n=1 Tax=Mammaliicoccus sciuri TaxID=1296 RepID=UPI0019540D68|nr:hypothetical protein [Mammaliicoccus sciuri]MEB8372848.1 hypothetical protein [Mammaliicoccus sciuri]
MSKKEVIELLLQEEKTYKVELTLVTNKKIDVDKISYNFASEGLLVVESPEFIVIDENSIVSIQPISEIDVDSLDQISF